MVAGRVATSGRVSATNRIATSGRISAATRQGFIFSLIGNGLVAYYRPDVGTYQLINGKVSSLADLSGNGHTMVQSLSSRRPSFTTNSLNGKSSLTFTGSQWLQSDLIQTASKPWTMGGVFKSANNAAVRSVFSPSNANLGQQLCISLVTVGKRGIQVQLVGSLEDGTATTNPEVWVATAENSAGLTQHKLYTGVSNTQQSLTNSLCTSFNPTGNTSVLGTIKNTGVANWIGEIWELFFINRVMSDSERANYLSYVTQTYGAI